LARNRKRAKERRARGETRAAVRPRLAAAPQDAAPDPIEHATPDVELADAQLALGSPGQVDPEELEFEEEETEPTDNGQAIAAAVPAAVAVGRPSLISRVVGFLKGSWGELQRVQWPDRRQVAQATGVVIGFVIVAGVFLGVSDLVASKLINFILK